ncbi:Uncharacterised protein [Mycobacteroides abscessus subsp. abscessus]|nr:Uncharacterised protein [Mycobacteroides abscessus subsp. abscessus]
MRNRFRLVTLQVAYHVPADIGVPGLIQQSHLRRRFLVAGLPELATAQPIQFLDVTGREKLCDGQQLDLARISTSDFRGPPHALPHRAQCRTQFLGARHQPSQITDASRPVRGSRR